MPARSHLGLTCVLLAVLLGFSRVVFAAAILSPTAFLNSTFSENPDPRLSPSQAIDQSGVPAFVSGITDTDAYLAGSPGHAALGLGNAWSTPGGAGSIVGSIEFDLGDVFSVDRFILWGDDFSAAPSTNSAPRDFSLESSLTADFSSSTLLGSFTGASAIGNPIPAQVFTFQPTNARFVRWSIESNHGTANLNIGEVAFSVSAPAVDAPAPATLALLVLGLLGLRLRSNA